MGFEKEELEEKYSRHLQPSVKLLQKSPPEYSVMHAAVTKRSGLSVKSRMLILTNKARLMYFDQQGNYKGNFGGSSRVVVAIFSYRTSF